MRAASLCRWRNPPSPEETAASGVSTRRALSWVRFCCSASRPSSPPAQLSVCFFFRYSAIEPASSSRAQRSNPGAIGHATFPWIASSLALLAMTVAVLLLPLLIPHSEGRAARGVSTNGPVGAAGPSGPSFETRLRRSSARGRVCQSDCSRARRRGQRPRLQSRHGRLDRRFARTHPADDRLLDLHHEEEDQAAKDEPRPHAERQRLGFEHVLK